MMECIGIQNMNFKAQDGGQVNGCKIFFTYQDDHVEGMACDSVFVSAAKLEKLTFAPDLGQAFNVLYNKYGKVADIVPA